MRNSLRHFRQKLSLKKTAYLTLAGLTAMLLGYTIPSGYKVEQTFEISGKVEDPATVPQEVGTRAEAKCVSTDSYLRIRCSKVLPKRSLALKEYESLSTRLPRELNWIFPNELRNLVTTKREYQSNLRSELREIEIQLQNLEPVVKRLEMELNQRKKRHDAIETDLSNRSRQLKILTEAVAQGTDPDRKALFLKKKSEVERTIVMLKAELEEARVQLEEVAAPARAEEVARKRQESLLNEISSIEKAILSWEQTAKNTPETIRVRHPESFQLQAINPSSSPTPVRSAQRLYWMFLFGVLLFFSIQKLVARPKKRASRATFHLPEEAASQTGLAILAKFRFP